MEPTDIAVTAVLLALITLGIARWLRERRTTTTTGERMDPLVTVQNLTLARAKELDDILADIVTREIDRLIVRGENRLAMEQHMAALAEIRGAVLSLARFFEAQGVYKNAPR